jgi:hypothetical protein
MLRRARARRRFAFIVILCLIGGAVYWVATHQRPRDNQALSDAASVNEVAPTIDTQAAEAAPATPDGEDAGEAADTAAPEAAVTPEAGAPPAATGAVEPQSEGIVDAIAAARVAALDAGKPVKWHADGQHGYVLPSADATVAGDNSCRSVYTTTRVDGTDRSTPVEKWCHTEGSDWIRR